MNNKFTVNDLNLYYGDFHALKNINLDIKEKEITAFIGPSGCGKSTLLRCIARVEKIDKGQILIDLEWYFNSLIHSQKVFMTILRMAQEFLESKRKVNWMKLLKEV